MITDSQDNAPQAVLDRRCITFVCTGNICRSPMAERLFAHALIAENEPLRSLEVISTGTYAGEGYPASRNAVAALKKVGLDLANHKSRPLTQDLIDQSLAIFTMTQMHRRVIEEEFDKTTPHVYLMREFLLNPKEVETPDPYGLSLSTYEACRDSIVEAIPSIVKFLNNQLSKKTSTQ